MSFFLPKGFCRLGTAGGAHSCWVIVSSAAHKENKLTRTFSAAEINKPRLPTLCLTSGRNGWSILETTPWQLRNETLHKITNRIPSVLLCPSDTWAGVKLFTSPHRVFFLLPGQCQPRALAQIGILPWCSPSISLGLSLVCRETESRRKIPQETAVCHHPWLRRWCDTETDRAWQRLADSSALPSGDQALLWHCCEPRLSEKGSVSKPCLLFPSWFLKNSGFLPDHKSRTLLCAYLSSYLTIALLLNKVVGQRILQRRSECSFQQQIKAAVQVNFLPISQSQYLLLLADWFSAWKNSIQF